MFTARLHLSRWVKPLHGACAASKWASTMERRRVSPKAKGKRKRAVVTAAEQVLPHGTPDILAAIALEHVPCIVLRILLVILLHPLLPMNGPIDAAELFAGEMAVTLALQALGLVAIPYEIKLDNVCMDLNSNPGFALAIGLVARLAMNPDGGLLWMAPVCSTWIYLAMGVTLRSRFTPDGDTDLRSVRDANLMARRCVLLAQLADAFGITWILEQPKSSVMAWSRRFQGIIKNLSVYVSGEVHMGAYGGSSEKSLKLYSNKPWVGHFNKRVGSNFKAKDNTIWKTYVDKRGKKSVTGGTGLKATQAYPKPFGRKVAEEYKRNRTPCRRSPIRQPRVCDVLEALANMHNQDPCGDAEMGKVLAYLVGAG